MIGLQRTVQLKQLLENIAKKNEMKLAVLMEKKDPDSDDTLVMGVDIYPESITTTLYVGDELHLNWDYYLSVISKVAHGDVPFSLMKDERFSFTIHETPNHETWAGNEKGPEALVYAAPMLKGFDFASFEETISRMVTNERASWDAPTRDRRHSEVYMRYVKNVKSPHPQKINLYVDTSSSVKPIELYAALLLIDLLKVKLPHIEYNFFAFSDEVYDFNPLVDNIHTLNRGGTMLIPVLAHMEEQEATVNVVVGDMDFYETLHDEFETPDNIVWVGTKDSYQVRAGLGRLGAKEGQCFGINVA